VYTLAYRESKLENFKKCTKFKVKNVIIFHISMLFVSGEKLEAPIRSILVQQKDKLHNKSGNQDGGPQGNILSAIFEKFVLVMVVYFVVSIIHSLAHNYAKRKATSKK